MAERAGGHRGRTMDYAAWREERRALLGRQVELLRSGPESVRRTHRPRSDEEWEAIRDGVRAELRRREASGRWTWVGPRRMVVRLSPRR